jgi:dipeptidyl aminopeptidase/acylaminoacyl peptidase
VSVSPDGASLVQATGASLPGIDILARRFLGLAGERIDPLRNTLRRTRFNSRLTILAIGDGTKKEVAVGDEGLLGAPLWSPDSAKIAFVQVRDDGYELWVAETSSADARALADFRVNDVLGRGFSWMPGSGELLVRMVPNPRSAAPVAPRTPGGPSVQETSERSATNRTYQDLLGSTYDEALFEHYATTQLALVDLGGKVSTLGKPGLISRCVPSPSGELFLVEKLRRPFSYVVPHYRFARTIEVWDRAGQIVHQLVDLDVADAVPIQGVRTGPRRVHWQPLESGTLIWTEALDGGDPRKKVEHRDRLMTLAAPFQGDPRELRRITHRLGSLEWTERKGELLLTEFDRDRRWLTTHNIRLAESSMGRVLFDRSARDAYGDPGRPVHRTLESGKVVARVEKGSIFMAGSGATPEGFRPFLDRVELATGAKERLFTSEADRYGQFEAFTDTGAWIIRRQSPTEPPNYFVAGGKEQRLTEFPDPHPQLTGIKKRVLKYKRRDGVPLSGVLYLPPDYQEGTRLPLVVWAYPVEYNDKSTAGQVRVVSNSFTRLRGTSPLLFLTQGYAVLHRAAMPIVGDPETMNDTFVRQIVDSGKAAIDAVVREGVADPDRVAVGGHSYGAFMTANLLAHSDLFRAGIARSGAYNRSLTPFGFQSERRTLWEATDKYVEVSPLFSAHKLKRPILLIHGEVDDNSGTFPLQSKRLFHALQGLGGTARLVVLPHESHGYRARESILHVLAEQFEWLDRHVKNHK